MRPEIGSGVNYSIGGKTFLALVLSSRDGEVSHLGADGEPLLHLAYVDPERDPKGARERHGYVPSVFTVFDVVHASHTFSKEFKDEQGLLTRAQLDQARGQGEWSELDPLPSGADLDAVEAERELTAPRPFGA